MVFTVTEPAEVVLQVVAAGSAGRVVDERLDVLLDGVPVEAAAVAGPHSTVLHLVEAGAGRLHVLYRAELEAPGPSAEAASVAGSGASSGPAGPSLWERQLHLRPSRYCPSDHLVGFAVAEFGAGPDAAGRVASITEWIRRRIGYEPGSSDVHDSAEDTLLTGMGTCRDFAHLGIALCRATGIPARFAAVYAPGLSPMDFHAVFETWEGGSWCVHDPTGLAPRQSLVRVATGRDATDTAFAAVTRGLATLDHLEVVAVTGGALPFDDHRSRVELH
ncbi:transglutaminase family protein [Acidiferrimicrobium sp. IK]|uniref:transglutaminase-like domain-containing protein n=1 Tax=Acidiferrimicrobium sp. IK TaxID=2871700 RepID=UPI0021CAF593|nr:transglutaminase family protein [Acidiferrimicrobium sp. IK]MCU4186262.1 transglutaminase family protein [Acidiferrimicrobium sp. IK]